MFTPLNSLAVRGIGDDVDLMTWLHEQIWPYESTMTEEDSYISTLICGIELIHIGVSINFATVMYQKWQEQWNYLGYTQV